MAVARESQNTLVGWSSISSTVLSFKELGSNWRAGHGVNHNKTMVKKLQWFIYMGWPAHTGWPMFMRLWCLKHPKTASMCFAETPWNGTWALHMCSPLSSEKNRKPELSNRPLMSSQSVNSGLNSGLVLTTALAGRQDFTKETLSTTAFSGMYRGALRETNGALILLFQNGWIQVWPMLQNVQIPYLSWTCSETVWLQVLLWEASARYTFPCAQTNTWNGQEVDFRLLSTNHKAVSGLPVFQKPRCRPSNKFNGIIGCHPADPLIFVHRVTEGCNFNWNQPGNVLQKCWRHLTTHPV